MVIIIALLALAVVHAASKAQTMEAANAAQAQTLPPNTAIAATGATPTPSPASAMGAPGAAGSFEIKLDTNSTYPTSSAAAYTKSGVWPGQSGLPLPMVPGAFQAGFNATPLSDKSLSTQTRPARLNNQNFNAAFGVPYKL